MYILTQLCSQMFFMFLPSVCSTSQYFQHYNKNEKIDIILVQYKAIYMVVKLAARRGRKKRRKKKRDEKYTEPSWVDEWTFINAVTKVGRVRRRA